jgi:hypothetical protein
MRVYDLARDDVARQAHPHENSLYATEAPLGAVSEDEFTGGLAPRWVAFVNLVAGCIPRCKSGELNPIATGQALRALSQRYFVGVSGRDDPEIERTDRELDASQQQIDMVLLAFWNATKRYAVVNGSAARVADNKPPVYSFEREVATEYVKSTPPPPLAKNLTAAERRALARGRLHVDE